MADDVAKPTQPAQAPSAHAAVESGGAPGRAVQTGAARRPAAQRGAAQGGAAPAGAAKQRVQVSPADVPDVPKLADDVVVTGAMEESAFEEEQYLVQRSGRFIQLTELLYRIVERIDGQRSVEEIAKGLKAGDGKEISGDDVRKLIAEKLIPIGLVAKADGSVVQSTSNRSLLMMNAKMAMIPPALLRPITAVFAILFWPPVLLPLLAVCFAAVGYVFFVHGVAKSVHDTLYTPGLLVAVLGLIVASAFFHEFGHASGLKAGGADVRGMGAGLYLAYPAFYTDVTENYKLPRWSRVRTDLGGFYFNLIFALGLVALAIVTGSEFLYAMVALVCLEIVHQMLPLVRLDGYWALADMLGIPDFFSQMGAFLRSVVPFWPKTRDGRKLPRLRWWARIAYGLYILIVIPLLAVMFFVLIQGLPRLLATAFDAAGKMAALAGEAIAKGEWLNVVAAGLQLVLIAIPLLGIALVLARVAKRVGTAAWTWSEGSLPKRAIALANGVALAALLVFLWIPGVGNVAGVESGALRAQLGSFEPIKPDERGVVGQAAPVVNDLLRPLGVPVPSLTPRPSPSPSPTPAASPTALPTSTATPAPVIAPTPVRTVAPTPAPTVAPTPIPTASATSAP